MDCQTRYIWIIDLVFNASFASLNVAKLMIKARGIGCSMSNFKALMADTFPTKSIIDMYRYRSNYTLFNYIFKELLG